MRRALFLVSASVLLASCALQPSRDPAAVLADAAEASRTLESVRFSANGFVQPAYQQRYDFSIDGILQDAGRQVQAAAAIRTQRVEDAPPSSIAVELIVPTKDEVNVRIGKVTGDDPFIASPAFRAMQGTWYRLPSESGATVGSVAPDPQILRLQAQVVRVTADRGMEVIDGARSYHYDVVIDRDKLEAFLRAAAKEQGVAFDATQVRSFFDAHAVQGELWIDEESFLVRRLEWRLAPVSDDAMAAEVAVKFFDHNDAPQILPPADVVPFDPAAMTRLPVLDASQGDVALPPELEKQLMDSLFLDR